MSNTQHSRLSQGQPKRTVGEEPHQKESSVEARETPETETLPVSRSRRSMGAPEQFRKKLANDLWIGIGGNSEHAQSPKYRELPLNVLSQVGPQESSRGSSSRPVAELGSDTLNPSKFATGRSRSNNKRIDDESDDLEELRVQLRRKELDFEKLSNEFDHCRSRWEIEKEDIERQRDQALAANKYVQDVVRGLKAEGACRETLMKHLMKSNQTGESQETMLEEFRRTSEQIRKSVLQRDTELSAARRSDLEMKNTVQKMSSSDLDHRSEASRPSRASKQSSRQSASAQGPAQISNMPTLPISRITQPILIIDKESSERTLDSLENCFQKIRYENSEFRRVIDTLATDRSTIASMKERILARTKYNAEPAAITAQERRYLQSSNTSMKQQLQLNDTALAELRKHHRRVSSQLRDKDGSLLRTKKQLENESLGRVHAEEQLCIYRLKCEQLQNSIEELSQSIEEIAKTNTQLTVEISQSRNEREDVERNLQKLRQSVAELEQAKLELEYKLSVANEGRVQTQDELKQELFLQKMTYEAQTEELKSEVEFLKIGFDRSKELDGKLADIRKDLKVKDDLLSGLKQQLKEKSEEALQLTESMQAKDQQLAASNNTLEQYQQELQKLKEEYLGYKAIQENTIVSLQSELAGKNELLSSNTTELTLKISKLTAERTHSEQQLRSLQEQFKVVSEEASSLHLKVKELEHNLSENAQHLTESSVTLQMREHQLEQVRCTIFSLEQSAQVMVNQLAGLQKQLAETQASLRTTSSQLVETTAKLKLTTVSLEQQQRESTELRKQLGVLEADLNKEHTRNTELEVTQHLLEEQLKHAEAKAEDYSIRSSDVTEILSAKNSEISELLSSLLDTEHALGQLKKSTDEKTKVLEERLSVLQTSEEVLKLELTDRTAAWQKRIDELNKKHEEAELQLKTAKQEVESELAATREESMSARKILEEQFEAKERLIRDRSKSLEMLLEDFNNLSTSNKQSQAKAKALEEELGELKHQLEAVTLEEIIHRMDVARLHSEIQTLTNTLETKTKEYEEASATKMAEQEKVMQLTRKLAEAHTLQLHLEQTVTNIKGELSASSAEFDKTITQLNKNFSEVQQTTATSQIELQLARSEAETTELRRYELAIVLEKVEEELTAANTQVASLEGKLQAKENELRSERSMASQQSRELLTAIDSLQEQQRQYQQTRDRVNELESQSESLKKRIEEMSNEIVELKAANEAELIQIKEEYEVSLSIVEQLRATIVYLQTEKQKLLEQQARQDVSALEISEIQGKSTERNRADILEDLPKQMMSQQNNTLEDQPFTDRVMDENIYGDAISQLIAKAISKESQLLIRPLSLLFKRLYVNPRPTQLVRLCEQFLEGVRLYNQDISSRLSLLRSQAKSFSSAADTILKQEPPKSKPTETSTSRSKLPQMSKLSLSSDVGDKSATRSADRRELISESKQQSKRDPMESSMLKGQNSSRLMKRPSMLVADDNNIESLLRQDEKDEEAIVVEQMEKSMRISGGDHSPEEMSQHSKQPSEIKSELVQAVKAEYKSKMESANMKAHINTYRRPTVKKPGKK